MVQLTAEAKTEVKRIITQLLNPPFGSYVEWLRTGERGLAEALDEWHRRVKEARQFMEAL